MIDEHREARAGSPTARPRPHVHFTPATNWMNDPNGLVVVDGTYHLFYQHNPDAPRWGNLHWGHATSHDLVRWEHHPVALAPDEHGQIFSGTAVLDTAGSAGLGEGVVVAAFTHDLDGRQRQSLAVSTDSGMTWTMHADNPVIDTPPGAIDFRDPRLLRFGSGDDSWWVIVLAVGPELWVYRSDDLTNWELTSTMRVPSPWPSAIVEVPELVRVPVEGTDEWLWVLIVGFIPEPGAERVAGRVCWMVVDFDGETVVPRSDVARPLDLGADFYAAMAWELPGDGVPVCIGWLDERPLEADGRPAEWCGRLSLPRRLSVVSDGGELHLVQQPVMPSENDRWPLPIGAEPTRIDAPTFALHLDASIGSGSGGRVVLGLDATGRTTTVTVTERGIEIDRPGLEPIAADDVVPGADAHRVLVVVDAGSIEIFWNGGRRAVSEIGPLGLGPTGLTLQVEGDATVVSASIEHLGGDMGGTAL